MKIALNTMSYSGNGICAERSRVRDAIKKGKEPPETRTRSSIKWDES